MNIKELIKILKEAPDQEKDIYVESLDNYWTSNIGFSFDDNNDLQLYEVVKEKINQLEKEISLIPAQKEQVLRKYL